MLNVRYPSVADIRATSFESQAREMFDPAGRDDEAIDAGRVEDEAQGGFRHRQLSGLGRPPQPFDRGEGLLVEIACAGVRRMGQAAARRWFLAEPIFAAEEPAGER